VLSLKIYRARIAQNEMMLLPIAKHFDIFKNSRIRFLTDIIKFSVRQLNLQGAEETTWSENQGWWFDDKNIHHFPWL